jgi:hypothetical protein
MRDRQHGVPPTLTMRGARRAGAALTVSALLALATVVGQALRVRAAIRRINDAGAVVVSFEPMPLAKH